MTVSYFDPARLVRSGLSLPISGDSVTAKAIARDIATIGGRLQAIADDPRASLRERDLDAKAALQAARASLTAWKTKLAQERDALDRTVADAHATVRSWESRLSPLELHRATARAEELKVMTDAERAQALAAAVDGCDLHELAAHRLVPAAAKQAGRATYALLVPGAFAEVLQKARTIGQTQKAVDVALAGVAQLDAADGAPAWAIEPMRGDDMLALANHGPARTDPPAAWPAELRGLA